MNNEPSFQIKLSEQLLEGMILAAIEAYVLGDQKNNNNRERIETLGYIWGSKKTDESRTILYLDRASVSLSAKRSNGAVKPNQYAAELKDNFVTHWSPHLMLLGDFHTHPYDNLTEVKRANGWEFSDDDLKFLADDDFLWERSQNTPVNLVIAICRLGKVRESFGARMLKPNLWQFDAGEFRFWLNANVGCIGPEDCRQIDVDPDRIFLNLDTRFYNEASYKITAHIR